MDLVANDPLPLSTNVSAHFLSSWRISFPLILRNFLLRDRQAVAQRCNVSVFASFLFNTGSQKLKANIDVRTRRILLVTCQRKVCDAL